MPIFPPAAQTQERPQSPVSHRGDPKHNHLAQGLVRLIAAEWRIFAQAPRPMQVLLLANGIYALVLPVIEIFVAAYILRSSRSMEFVILCQLVIYAATPLGFAVNGFLLWRIAANRLYAAGMILTGIALFCLILSPTGGLTADLVSAALLGFASGLFWANRGYLVLIATRDSDRNYYYGIETCVVTLTSVMVPLTVAWLFSHTQATGITPAAARHGYILLAVASLFVATLAAGIVGRGSLRVPPRQNFVFFRSHLLWRRMLSLATLKAVAQGYIITAPAMLIFRFIGHEQTLGVTEALGGCLTASLLYLIGRHCEPSRRVAILASGQLVFLAGSVASAVSFNQAGVLIFMACLFVAKPLIDLGYYPIQFCVTNAAAVLEQRNDYSYLMSHECATFAGRLIGCAVFVAITRMFSDVAALRYALPIIALIQLPAISVARRLTGER